MSDWVPDEIADDILLRLPVRSLLRFQSVCKHWQSVINSSEFTERSVGDVFLLTKDSDSYIYSIPPSTGLRETSPEILPQCHSRVPFKKDAVICGASRGLVCLADLFTTVICILNPATRKHHITQAPVRDGFLTRYHNVCYSVVWMLSGYDSGAKDYKFVRVCSMANKFLGGYESEVISVGIRSNTLQSVRLPNNNLKRMQQRLGVLVGQALHWPFRNGENSIVIVAYDLGANQSREIPPPLEVLGDDPKKVTWKLVELRNCLCLCEFDQKGSSHDVWMMKEYGVRTSWSKLFSVRDSVLLLLLPQSSSSSSPVVPLALSMNGDEVVLHLDGGSLVWYDIKKGRASQVMHLVADRLVSAGDNIYRKYSTEKKLWSLTPLLV